MNLLKDAKIEDIYEKITRNCELDLEIRYYQRPYRWPAKKVYDLFEDYKENKQKAAGKVDALEYFLGAIVLVDLADGSKPNYWKYQVVDGQQRLTTLFLFNYLKFLMLINIGDVLAERKSLKLEGILKEIEYCYGGFIGKQKIDIIKKANDDLFKACEDAIRAGDDVDVNRRNNWRKALGWIENPDLSDTEYITKCIEARKSFFAGETLKLFYSNDTYNEKLKNALAQLVMEASSVNSPYLAETDIEISDDEDESVIEWPFIQRAHNIFSQIIIMFKEESPAVREPMEVLTGYIDIINEMLKNIKLCMIISSSEDDAFKLFETLNDRSESVSDLELIKDYFYKTYAVTSGEPQPEINKNMAEYDRKWNDDIFIRDDIKERIAYCASVFFTGKSDIKPNDVKRKSVKSYLDNYSETIPYTKEIIERDFDCLLYISHTLSKIIPSKKNDFKFTSMYVENEVGHNEASVVKRALALVVHLDQQAVYSGIICDILHNYFALNIGLSFNEYLEEAFDELKCKKQYPGLWENCNVIWKTAIMASRFNKPKFFSDIIVSTYNINTISNPRDSKKILISYSSTSVDEKELREEFKEWIENWTFSDGIGKIKIKNLFIHMLNRYNYDASKNSLTLLKFRPSYTNDIIEQDLDHMDAKKIIEGRENEFFSYTNKGHRVKYTVLLITNVVPLLLGTFAETCSLNLPQKGRKAGHDCLWAVA